MSTLRRRLAGWMRTAADRLDHEGAPKITGWSFTFECGRGLVFNEEDRGCRLAYLGDGEYERAHAEADHPAPRVPWRSLAEGGQQLSARGTVTIPRTDLAALLAIAAWTAREHGDTLPEALLIPAGDVLARYDVHLETS